MHEHDTFARDRSHLHAMRAWSATLAAHYLQPYVGESLAWLLCWHASWRRVATKPAHIRAVRAASDGYIAAGSTLVELARQLQRAQGDRSLGQLNRQPHEASQAGLGQHAVTLPAPVRMRLLNGLVDSGADIAALRALMGVSQRELAEALDVEVPLLRTWERDQFRPEGPARVLLCLLARHPWLLRGQPDAWGRRGRDSNPR